MTHPAANSRLRVIRRRCRPPSGPGSPRCSPSSLAVNAAGWGIFVLYVLPHHFDYKGEGGSAGLGVGHRRRDHRVVPRLPARVRRRPHLLHRQHDPQADGRRQAAPGTGFFFSFGHSTVIVAVGVGITIAARAVFGAVVDPSSAYETAGGAIGTAAVGRVPVPDRAAQPDRAGRHLQGLPRDARGRLQRAAA